MNGLEKEAAMIQSIVLDKDLEGMAKKLPESSLIEVPFEIVNAKGVIWKNGELQVTEAGGVNWL